MKKETFHLLMNFLIILRIDLHPLSRRYKKAKSLVKNAPHRLHGRFLTRLFPFLCRVIKRIRRIFATLFATSLRKITPSSTQTALESHMRLTFLPYMYSHGSQILLHLFLQLEYLQYLSVLLTVPVHQLL